MKNEFNDVTKIQYHVMHIIRLKIYDIVYAYMDWNVLTLRIYRLTEKKIRDI